jgi:RimJ/RimL family protein N-acetyltransferase
VVQLVARRPDKSRATPERVVLQPAGGMPGDAWTRRMNRNPDVQLTLMDAAVAGLVANGQALTTFGDNLFLDLDLSAPNLPVGSHLRIGTATVEVTPKPHNGCDKFAQRFGQDALEFVQHPATRHLNLRGVHGRTIAGGELALGDSVEVLSRPEPLYLRPVLATDMDALFDHQADPDAAAKIPSVPRGRDSFDRHWQKVRADPANWLRTIVWRGEIVGSVVSFERDGQREVGWQVGRAFWGRGIAKRAVALFVAEFAQRPLVARVWQGNPASRKVAEHAGFVLVGTGRYADSAGVERVEDVLRLD